jgi:hypothetical protein
MEYLKTFLALVGVLAAGSTLTSCDQRQRERTEDKIERGVDKTGDEIEKAGDKIEEKTDR